MRYADRLEKLGTETAFEVLRKIQNFPEKRRKNVISFSIGEPDFSTPKHIKKAGIKAIKDDMTNYTPSAGIPELREAVAQFVAKNKNIEVGPNNIVILPSAKFVVDLSILSCTNPGDEVIYPNPGYPIYESLIKVHGCKPVTAQLKEEENWNYNLEDLKSKISDKTKMIIINSPQNPTGSVLNEENLKVLADLAIENDLWILTDEIYSKIVFDDLEYTSIASYPGMQERTIILDGFSKYFSMTGWRLGYAVVNEELAGYIGRWATNTISCTAGFTQKAGLEAMKADKGPSEKMVQAFEERRNLIHKRLNDIEGISAKLPKGAFYMFANVTGACEQLGFKSSLEFQNYLLEEIDVAVLSREYFGSKLPNEDDLYVRFSYCVSTENIQEGMNRIQNLIENT
ncbi:MAG: Aminotransferase [Promethearchaeota archaeon]|nr:MAG: Aminotransferase [Candidatus Lokiarchaeota archaeon]